MKKSQTAKVRKVDTRYLTIMGILTSIIIVMLFTPLGYLKVGLISITFYSIPIAIGAIMLGPTAGAILGGIFGITSFAQCFGLDTFGTALFGINPFFTFILCIVPRILMGLCTGLVFRTICKIDKTKTIVYPITCMLCSLFNTIFFMIFLTALFWHYDSFFDMFKDTDISLDNVFIFAVTFVGINALIEAAAALIVGGSITTALCRKKNR